ncbi:MAG: hydrolase, partial [Desulfohalobiaceae bacterium]
MLMQVDNSCLVVVDVQEKMAPEISGRKDIENKISILLQAAGELQVPVLFTEQYPKGLGSTLEYVREHAPDAPLVTKMHFDCCQEEEFLQQVRSTGRTQILLTGMEAHICVLQTGMSLLQQGYSVFAVADGTGSRAPKHCELALQRLCFAGAEAVCTEMVLFEWLQKAGTESF